MSLEEVLDLHRSGSRPSARLGKSRKNLRWTRTVGFIAEKRSAYTGWEGDLLRNGRLEDGEEGGRITGDVQGNSKRRQHFHAFTMK
jgi:hypothetical protein